VASRERSCNGLAIASKIIEIFSAREFENLGQAEVEHTYCWMSQIEE
jgi:hypothetical protein